MKPLTPERIEEIERSLEDYDQAASLEALNEAVRGIYAGLRDLLSEVKRLRAKEGMTSTQD